MKVLMTTDTIGGVWTYSLDMARALGQYNIEVVLATMGPPPASEQLTELQALSNVKPYVSNYKLEWMDDPWDDVDKAGQWLLSIRDQEDPDMVHLNGYSHGSLKWDLPCLIAGHSCVMSWWEAVKGESAPESWNIYKQKVAAGIDAVDMLIAPNRSMLEALKKHYGAKCDTCVVPNGRDYRMFKPGTKESFIFAAGRTWDEAKNIKALENIAPYLVWPVYVAGDGEHPENGLRVLDNVHVLGRLSSIEMPSWYARASVYALPARYEPFGYSALEAGLAGCALVLGDIPSLREVWEDCAVFVEPNDEQELEYCINSLISDEGKLNELAMKSLVKALHYTPKRMLTAYLSAISSLLPVDADIQISGAARGA